MNRRLGNSTAALLQKANSQLKGERVVRVSEEDDLNAYISSLSKRTAGKKSLDLDEDSDISISNEDYQYGATPVTTSRYLKKKGNVYDSLDSVESTDHKNIPTKSFLKTNVSENVKGIEPSPYTRPSTSRGHTARSSTLKSTTKQSSALTKAQALTTKISQRPVPTRQSNVFTLDTDSEDSFHKANVPSKPTRSPSPMRSASDSSMSLGKDGGKFVKKKTEPPAPPEFLTTQRPSTPTQKKRPLSATVAGAKGRKVGGNVMLSSEEESLAEFIEGLSGSEISLRASSPAKRAVSTERSPSPDSKPPLHQASASPRSSHRNISTPKPNVTKRSTSPPSRLLSRSISEESLPSEVHMLNPESISYEEEDDPFKVNVVMDLDTLGPVMSLDLDEKDSIRKTTEKPRTVPASSPFYKTSDQVKHEKTPVQKKSSIYTTKKKKDSKSRKNKKENDVFSSLGLHTVDELIGTESKSSKELSVISDISDILTDKPRDVFKANRSKTINDTITANDTEIHSEVGKLIEQDYSDGFESISEKIGEVISQGSSVSEVKTEYSGSENQTVSEYTADFSSDSEAVSDSKGYDSDSHSQSDTNSISSRSSSPRTYSHRSKVDKKSVEVQTGDQPGLTYQWNSHHSGMAFMGPSFGIKFLDPTPIASHSVSPGALEALTSYSPAMLALHGMLKQQLELTQTFIQAQHYLYNSYTKSIEPEQKYTTLEDTKKYIQKHRKPRLTFKQALKMVDKEMS